jgi:hypothetical protein
MGIRPMVGVLAMGLALAVIAVGFLGKSKAENQMDGKNLAEWMIAGAATSGQMNLRDSEPRYCFIKSYSIMQTCLRRCFKEESVKFELEFDMSDGYWFAAYKMPDQQDRVLVAAIPQRVLVWDFARDEMARLSEEGVEKFLKNGCGFADAITVESRQGQPVIADDLPGMFSADGIYREITPTLAEGGE